MLTSNSTQTNVSINSSTSSLDHLSVECLDTNNFIFVAFYITKTLVLLPLYAFVLYLGLQRWRPQRSFSTASHSDIFTYNMAATETISFLGSVIFACSRFLKLSELLHVGVFVTSMISPGQLSFHILTCVERYLAVVHPVTYRGLRQSGGVKIRNISIVCVWLLCFVWGGIAVLTFPDPPTPFFCLFALSSIVASFCGLRVLCVLIRPGPGDQKGRDKGQVDQSKQRAFYTVMAITGVLWFWFAGSLTCLGLYNLDLVSHSASCVIVMAADFFSLPSSLVLPLLFLHRAGKLLWCI